MKKSNEMNKKKDEKGGLTIAMSSRLGRFRERMLQLGMITAVIISV